MTTHVQCNNQIHIVGPHIRCTTHTAAAIAALCSSYLYMSLERLPVLILFDFATPRISNQPYPEGEPCIRVISNKVLLSVWFFFAGTGYSSTRHWSLTDLIMREIIQLVLCHSVADVVLQETVDMCACPKTLCNGFSRRSMLKARLIPGTTAEAVYQAQEARNTTAAVVLTVQDPAPSSIMNHEPSVIP